jgi:ABC-type transport system involved in multi-copper enzyme maturation permease subunit
MIGRHSLGPVFVFDMLSLARRWQVYAARSAFVLFLLVGILIAWVSTTRMRTSPPGATSTLREMAEIGKSFFFALAGVQLSFILLAAPAAAAGAICIDRARGTLLHMMVTDLSDAEIVLGRLGSRLMPVFGLVACGVPVATLAGLLGGMDFGALVGLFVVSIALAILGCSLALAISVKAAKTHEVLMAVYFAVGVWLLSLPFWWGMIRGTKIPIPPDWFQNLNPYFLVYAPYTRPGLVKLADFTIFFAVMMGISALLVGWSILRLRRAVVESAGKPERPRRKPLWIARFWPSLPGPTLDGNPVLWREWHRNRPSRLTRWLWLGLLTLTWGMAAWGTYEIIDNGVSQNSATLVPGFMLQLFFGMLMVAAASPTVLAEERTRGSLDILLSTPQSTRSIVLAKWWGAYRTVLGLAILPAFTSIFLAAASPDVPVMAGAFRWPTPPIPLTLADRFLGAGLCVGDCLVSGALIVSIGVAIATWIPRLGRAVATSVLVFFMLGIGLPIAASVILPSLYFRGGVWVNYSAERQQQYQAMQQSITSLSPALGGVTPLETLAQYTFGSRDLLWTYLISIVLGKLILAAILLSLTLRTFDRCLGRVVESRRASYRPPLGPIARRKGQATPSQNQVREQEPEFAAVNDSPSPRP